jgi:hypothetical protein
MDLKLRLGTSGLEILRRIPVSTNYLYYLSNVQGIVTVRNEWQVVEQKMKVVLMDGV